MRTEDSRLTRFGADRFQLVSQLAGNGSVRDLHGHFVLGRSLPHEPEGWLSRRLGSWRLSVHPALPVHSLRAGGGEPLGWVLGHPLLRGVGAAPRTLVAPIADAQAGPDEVERWLQSFDGRFVALVVGVGFVFPDAVAALPVVFDAERELVSSSPFLIDAPGESVPDHELAAVIRTFETGLWFPFATTPHARAQRVQANHALRLSSWTQERRWPTRSFTPTDPDSTNELMGRRVTEVLTAASAGSHLNQSLTSGGDTRVLLACSRALLDRTSFFTVRLPDEVGAIDAEVATAAARRFGLDHRVLAWRPPAAEDVIRFMYRTGGLVGELRGSRAGATYAMLAPPDRVYVSGINTGLAPLGHDMGWRKRDRRAPALSPPELLRRFAMPRHPLLVAAAEKWLAELPDLDPLETLSLLSLELRFGNWGGALTTAYPDAYSYTLYPFGQRDVLEAMLGLPAGYRFEANQRADIVRIRWPDLLEVPLNPRPLPMRARSRLRGLRSDVGVMARRIGVRR